MSADWRCHLYVAEPVAVAPTVSIASLCRHTLLTEVISHQKPRYCMHTLQRNAF